MSVVKETTIDRHKDKSSDQTTLVQTGVDHLIHANLLIYANLSTIYAVCTVYYVR